MITLWDIGLPTLPSYDNVNPTKLLKLFPDYGDVYNIAWTGSNRWLLAGTAAGLVGYHIEDDEGPFIYEVRFGWEDLGEDGVTP